MSNAATVLMLSVFDKNKSNTERIKQLNNLSKYLDDVEVHREILEKYFDEDTEIRRALINLLFTSGYTNESIELSSDYVNFFEKMIYEENEEDLRLIAFRRYFDDVKHTPYYDGVMAALFIYEINDQIKHWALSFLNSHFVDEKTVGFLRDKAPDSMSPLFYRDFLLFYIKYDEEHAKDLMLEFFESSESETILNQLINFSFAVKDWDSEFFTKLNSLVLLKNNIDVRDYFYKAVLASNQFKEEFIIEIMDDLLESDSYSFILNEMSPFAETYTYIKESLEKEFLVEESLLNKELIIKFFGSVYSEKLLNCYFDEPNGDLKTKILHAQSLFQKKCSTGLLTKFNNELLNLKNKSDFSLILAILVVNQDRISFGNSLVELFFNEEQAFIKRSLYSVILNLPKDQINDENKLKFYSILLKDKLFVGHGEILNKLHEIETPQSDIFTGVLLLLAHEVKDFNHLKTLDQEVERSSMGKNNKLDVRIVLMKKFLHYFPADILERWLKELAVYKDESEIYKEAYTGIIKVAGSAKDIVTLDKGDQKEMFLSQFTKMMEEGGVKGFMELESYLNDSFDKGAIKKSDATKIIKTAFTWHQGYEGLVNLLTKFTKAKIFDREIVVQAVNFLSHMPTGPSWGSHGAGTVSYSLDKYINGYLKETKDFSVLDFMNEANHYETFFMLGLQDIISSPSSQWTFAGDWKKNFTDWTINSIDEDIPSDWLIENSLKLPKTDKLSILQPQYYILKSLADKPNIVIEKIDEIIEFYKLNKEKIDIFFLDGIQFILWRTLSRDVGLKEKNIEFFNTLHEDLKVRDNERINSAIA